MQKSNRRNRIRTDGGGGARRLSLELHVRNAAQAELLASMLVFCACTD
jgi:hypothetical protein